MTNTYSPAVDSAAANGGHSHPDDCRANGWRDAAYRACGTMNCSPSFSARATEAMACSRWLGRSSKSIRRRSW